METLDALRKYERNRDRLERAFDTEYARLKENGYDSKQFATLSGQYQRISWEMRRIYEVAVKHE